MHLVRLAFLNLELGFAIRGRKLSMVPPAASQPSSQRRDGQMWRSFILVLLLQIMNGCKPLT